MTTPGRGASRSATPTGTGMSSRCGSRGTSPTASSSRASRSTPRRERVAAMGPAGSSGGLLPGSRRSQVQRGPRAVPASARHSTRADDIARRRKSGHLRRRRLLPAGGWRRHLPLAVPEGRLHPHVRRVRRPVHRLRPDPYLARRRTFAVRLTATDAAGRTAETSLTVMVGGVAPRLTVFPGCSSQQLASCNQQTWPADAPVALWTGSPRTRRTRATGHRRLGRRRPEHDWPRTGQPARARRLHPVGRHQPDLLHGDGNTRLCRGRDVPGHGDDPRRHRTHSERAVHRDHRDRGPEHRLRAAPRAGVRRHVHRLGPRRPLGQPRRVHRQPNLCRRATGDEDRPSGSSAPATAR